MPKKGYKQIEEHKKKCGEAKKGIVPWWTFFGILTTHNNNLFFLL